jgi:hypothetical protein
MRMRMMFIAVTLCTGLAVAAGAQTPGPPASAGTPEVKLASSPPGQSAVQIGGTWQAVDGGQRYTGGKWIVVDYSRPLLRGRKNIFGSGAEYGKVVSDGAPVWRAGANATTTLTTQVPLLLGGKTIAPGVYNVFVDLKPDNWSLVLNTQERQPRYDPNDKVKLYGAYNYDSKQDVVRVPMRMETSDVTIEQFTIGFVNATDRGVTMLMVWETTCGEVDLAVAK